MAPRQVGRLLAGVARGGHRHPRQQLLEVVDRAEAEVLVGDRRCTGHSDRRLSHLVGCEPVGLASRAAAVDDRAEDEVVDLALDGQRA